MLHILPVRGRAVIHYLRFLIRLSNQHSVGGGGGSPDAKQALRAVHLMNVSRSPENYGHGPSSSSMFTRTATSGGGGNNNSKTDIMASLNKSISIILQ